MTESSSTPQTAIGKDLMTGEDREEKADVMVTSESLKINSSNTEHAVSLEDIQIFIPPENIEITHSANAAPEEKEDHSSRPEDLNVPSTREEKIVAMRRRRDGVVEPANGEGAAERRKARVLRKKFGEGMVHEMPSIFNKKL